MVRERVRCATECSGVNWLPMDVLRGRAGGAVFLSTLGGWSGVCTGDSGGAVAVVRWAITLGAVGGVLPWSRLGVLWRRGIWRNRLLGNRQEDVADAGEVF